jgi:hypothetical protein
MFLHVRLWIIDAIHYSEFKFKLSALETERAVKHIADYDHEAKTDEIQVHWGVASGPRWSMKISSRRLLSNLQYQILTNSIQLSLSREDTTGSTTQ